MLLLALLLAGQAHEIGTTRIDARVVGSQYVFEIHTDTVSLLEKLESAAGRPPVAVEDPAKRAVMLRAAEDIFRKKVDLRFDGAGAVPAVAFEADRVRLTGEVPVGAGSFTFSYGWTYATYSLQTPSSEAIWLEGGATSRPIPLTAARPKFSPWRYLVLGFTHIVPLGLDHMLFVLGLYLLNRRVLLQVSAFTIAHSITLGLSMYGLVKVPAHIVEPLIAISIAYVAIENLLLRDLKPWRIGLVFAFGLLHGMGFAGALQEIGLPRAEFLTALLTFNVGVEAGQLAVIAAAFLLFGWHWSERVWYRQRVVIPASLAIALAAVYWTFERVTQAA